GEIMKILVTGGAGFIGSHLVDGLIKRGDEVVVIDDLSSGKEKNLNPQATFYKTDICSKAISDIFEKEKPEFVFHLAAQTSVPESVIDPLRDAKVNILGTINLLKCSFGYGAKRFIFSSSVAVYGEPSDFPVKEDFFLKPVSPYGLSKKMAEECVAFFGSNFGLSYVILRYSNVYGPRQDPTGEAGVVSIFVSRRVKGDSVTIYGSGEQVRDFVYATDVVEASILTLSRGKGEVFNIASGIEISINELYETLDKKFSLKLTPFYAQKRAGDIEKMVLDVTKAKKVLGWETKTSLDKGLGSTIEYFRDMRQGT
ncbi:MAG: GDP-mannose 4,6-dehydratase, partial [Candidatus Subteraquimicrobiales bacterium]|nr:GDP-mannose 4,6-dehydratase [Candidatus Subteraquimicrobiales bacterium]